jgi:hypothetical protein
MLGGMADDQHNPYAPPAEASADVRAFSDGYEDGPNDFESERRPVILTILLAFVTLGFYQSIWLLRRRRFLDRQDTGRALGSALPIVSMVLNALSVIVVFGGDQAAGMSSIFSLAGGVTALVANFRVLNILRSVSSRTGRFLDFSTIGTFFLGIYYLQYKINQMADTPARAERPRKTKKRKKLETRDALEADADAELRAEEEARKALRAEEPPPAP